MHRNWCVLRLRIITPNGLHKTLNREAGNLLNILRDGSQHGMHGRGKGQIVKARQTDIAWHNNTTARQKRMHAQRQ